MSVLCKKEDLKIGTKKINFSVTSHATCILAQDDGLGGELGFSGMMPRL